MSLTRLPRLGSAGWARVEDADGFSKVRPVVVVTPTAAIAAGKAVLVVAITTRFPDALPDDHVLRPWDPQGKARSRLRRRCAAVASWQVEIVVDSLHQAVGILPPTVIAELLAKVESTLALPPSTVVTGHGDPPSLSHDREGIEEERTDEPT